MKKYNYNNYPVQSCHLLGLRASLDRTTVSLRQGVSHLSILSGTLMFNVFSSVWSSEVLVLQVHKGFQGVTVITVA